MDNLDIQIVDNLTVNLNQEEYSTEGQVLNSIDVYVEDGQLLFDAALTQDSINLYTRETPDIINIKEITDGISKLESLILKTSKEATLLAKVAELKEALNSIDFTAIEQAIQDVENITARESTLIQGVGDIIKAVENIDFTDLENSIAEVKNAVANIDFSALAKEQTLTQVASKVEEESQAIQGKIDNIDLTPIENKVDEGVNTLSAKIDNIKLPEIDTTELAKEATLNEVSSKLDNLNVEVDLSGVAKQGENAEATNSAILEVLGGMMASMYKGVPVVHLYPTDGGTERFTIQPNQYTIVHGAIVNLVLNKGIDIDGIVNHYMVRLDESGAVFNTVTFGGFSLKWLDGNAPNLGANGIFEISIINDLALYTKL